MVPNLSEKNEEALRGILRYCDNARGHVETLGNTFEKFQTNLALQEACSFDAIQIGESARNLSDDFKEAHQEIPWHEVIALRNKVAHAYGHIDQAVLWDTILYDFPPLRDFCAKQLGL